jgi:hypothetical protein
MLFTPGVTEEVTKQMAGYNCRRVRIEDLVNGKFLVMVDPVAILKNQNPSGTFVPGKTSGTALAQIGNPTISASELLGGVEVMNFSLIYPAKGRHSFITVDEVLHGTETALWFVTEEDDHE